MFGSVGMTQHLFSVQAAKNSRQMEVCDVTRQLTFLLRRSFCLKTPWRLTKRN